MKPDQELFGCYSTGRYAVVVDIWSAYSDELPIVLGQFDSLRDAIPLAISEARRRQSPVRLEDWVSEQRRQVLWEV